MQSESVSYRRAIEDLSAARKAINEIPACNKWFNRYRTVVKNWINRYRDRESWEAGWWHNYADPVSGEPLLWTRRVPYEETSYLLTRSGKRVEVTDEIAAAWVDAFRRKHITMVQHAARVYCLNGDESFARWAIQQIGFYATNYNRWKTKRQGAKIFFQSVTEATFQMVLIDAIRMLQCYIPGNLKAEWWNQMFFPQILAFNCYFQKIHNIACWHKSAIAQAALVYENDKLWSDAIHGRFGIKEQIFTGITNDSIWLEQSFQYGSYVALALMRLLENASLYNRIRECELEAISLKALVLAPMQFRFPNGSLPTMGDDLAGCKVPNKWLLRQVYRIIPTEVGLKRASVQIGWDSLVDPPSNIVAPRLMMPKVRSRSAHSSRFALLKKNSWHLFFHYGQLLGSHAHAEALNFSAAYKGIEITRDIGTVRYGSALHRCYCSEAPSHNVPLVDGEGQEFPELGKLLEFSHQRGCVAAAQNRYRTNASAERRLQIVKSKLFDDVVISTSDGKAHCLGLTFHFQGEVNLCSDFKPDRRFQENRTVAFRYWESVNRLVCRDSVQLVITYPGVIMQAHFHVGGNFKIWHGKTPDLPFGCRDSVYLEKRGRTLNVTTIFQAVEGMEIVD